MLRIVSKRELIKRLFVYFIPLTLIGVLLGAPFLLLWLGTFSLLVWNYRQLFRLSDWLTEQRKYYPPEGEGVWEQVFEGIYRLQQRNRRKRNELADVIRRFREGAEAVPDGVLVLQDDLAIVWCNKESIALLGLQWPLDHGQRLDNLIRRPDFIKYMRSKEYLEPLELQSPIDPHSVLEVRVTPYAAAQLMMVVRDVTLIKQLEEMRRDFIANVSHELRTPLTVMSGYLEMFDPDMAPPPAMWSKAQQTMLEQCKRMASLVEQLLALARIENSDKPDFEEEVDISDMLMNIYREAEQLNQEKQHTIALNIDDTLNVIGKEQELRSAFSNLVFNAIRYTPKGGEIIITWQKNETGAEFSVEDNGDGIATEHIHRLTERFYRVDQARSRDTGGSGLGLAITKHVLTRHDSHLNISSKVGEGSIFSFSFSRERLKNKKLEAEFE